MRVSTVVTSRRESERPYDGFPKCGRVKSRGGCAVTSFRLTVQEVGLAAPSTISSG